jgi:hypothetical protein
MKCPKCNGTATKSKYCHLTGYDSFRCDKCNHLFEVNFVFHAAHPEVRCLVVGTVDKDNYVDVLFEKEVTFRERQERVSKEWLCNKDLLCKTQEEARKKHKPN